MSYGCHRYMVQNNHITNKGWYLNWYALMTLKHITFCTVVTLPANIQMWWELRHRAMSVRNLNFLWDLRTDGEMHVYDVV